MTRVLAFLAFTALAAAAQESPTIEQLLLAGDACTDTNSGISSPTSPYVVVNTTGVVLRREDVPIRETETLTLYLVGIPEALQALNVRRTSEPRDYNRISFEGVSLTTVDQSALVGEDASKCRHKAFPLHDFAAGTGKVQIFTVPGGVVKQVGPDITVPVLAVYRGSISFGPMVSTLPERSYATVARGEETVLVEEGGSIDVEYALTFTYFLGARTRDETGPGLFLSIPMTGQLDTNVMVGGTYDVGSLFHLHGGLRLGRVSRLVDAQEASLNAVVSDDFTVVTEDVWKPALVIGLSIDGAAAAQAFGKIVKGLGGS